MLIQASNVEPVELVPAVCTDPPGWTSVPSNPGPPVGAVRWYGSAIVTKIMDWFWDAVDKEPGPVVWVSNAQLYIDYALTTGDAGPIHVHRLQDSADVPLDALLSIGFKERVRWFGRVLREILKHAGITCESRYCRPVSHMICMHASCTGVPMAEDRLCAADRWMAKFTRVPFRRQSRELDHLPVPTRGLA